jgi:hypothetical protein
MEKAIFVGYPAQHKGWEFFNPETKKFVLSDRADFNETVFPGLKTRLPEPPAFPPQSSSSTETPSPTVQFDVSDDLAPRKMHHQVGDVDRHDDAPPARPPTPPAPALRRSERSKVPTEVWKKNRFKGDYRSADHRVPPDHYRDPLPQIPSSDEGSDGHGVPEESESDVQPGEVSDESELIASESAYLTIPEALDVAYKANAHSSDPQTYAEAMALPDAQDYHNAAVKEIQSHLENGTWELATLPPGRKAIGCRWVFLIKRKSDGSIDRYKARLVAQGFSQRPGFDYGETYASTVKWATLRAILALGAF